MPFSDAQFAASWTVLEDRFNRKHNAQTVKIYRDLLEGELTGPQFSDACRAAFRFETYFPSPQRLIDLGQGTDGFKGRALGVWDTAMESMRKQERSPLSDVERRHLLGATNGVSLGQCETKELGWIKKEFVERVAEEYRQQAMSATPALNGVTVLKELTNATD